MQPQRPILNDRPVIRPKRRGRDSNLVWILLPILAVCGIIIWFAYQMGVKSSGPSPETASAPQPATTTSVPAPAGGKVSMVEVPPPVTAKPVVPSTPPPFPTGAGQVEPAVVLPADKSAPNRPNPSHPDPTGAGATEVERELSQINNPALRYPTDAWQEKVEGVTRVGFTVTERGDVENAIVEQSAGDQRLDDAALDYVNRLKFNPAVRKGLPASVTASRVVTFARNSAPVAPDSSSP